MPAPANNTTRFTDRVEDYVRYRPGYPDVLFATLRDVAGFSANTIIADIGSGTGISTSHLLAEGWEVFAVEPNAAMRAAAERAHGDHPRFHSIDGRAERTTLASASVDAVTVAQAFHWFDLDDARAEFVRILKPPRWAALIWNDRQATSPFLADYERLLRDFVSDYGETHHRNLDDAALRRFFGGDWRTYAFPHEQVFDFDGLRGRLMSSSYAPRQGHPRHEDLVRELRRVFDAHARDGRVRFAYEARLSLAPLDPA